MKQRDLKRLALLGITSGFIAIAQSGHLEARQDEISVDAQHQVAVHKCKEEGGCAAFTLAASKKTCKAEGGCGGLTASRDRSVNSHRNDLAEETSTDQTPAEQQASEDHPSNLIIKAPQANGNQQPQRMNGVAPHSPQTNGNPGCPAPGNGNGSCQKCKGFVPEEDSRPDMVPPDL